MIWPISLLTREAKGSRLNKSEFDDNYGKIAEGLNELHSGKSDTTHTHAGVYSLSGHNHDTAYLGKTATAVDSTKLGGVLGSGYARTWNVGTASSATWMKLCTISTGLAEGSRFLFLIAGGMSGFTAGQLDAGHHILDITLMNNNTWGMALFSSKGDNNRSSSVTAVYSSATTGTGVDIWLYCRLYSNISAICTGSNTAYITPASGVYTTTTPTATTSATIFYTIQQNSSTGVVQIPALGGLQLPNVANSAVNVFDWYEEGVWTPIVAGLTTAGTAVYTAQTGSYTRCGNRVTADFCAFGTFSTPPTGYPAIFGLPFAANNTTYAFSTGSVLHGYGTGVYIPYVEPAGVKVRLAKLSTAMSSDHTSPVFATDISATSFKMIGTITYHV